VRQGDVGAGILGAGAAGEILYRVAAYLIARYGEEILDWTLRRLVQRFSGPTPDRETPRSEPYFWEDPTAYCEDDDPCAP
jgi:hypothetical protein